MGRWNSAPLLPLAGLLTLCCCSPREGAPRTPGEHLGHYPESDIVHPVKVDGSGSFLTYDLSYRAISKRNLGSPDSASSRLYYGFNYGGQELRLNLSANPSLLAPGFVFERRYGGIAQAQIQHKAVNTCYLLGEIQGRTGEMGQAALSACDGLRGVFQLSKDDYFIEPLAGASPGDSATAGGNVPRPHRVYRRHVPERREAMETGRNVSEAERNQRRKTCGVKDSVTTLDKTEKRRESWDRKQKKRRSRESRSVSKEKWVEALVVADTKMVEYHGSKNVEHYILTVMNMVAGLFHDPSIGNPINIVIVRLVLLEEEEEDLKITHHADNTLKSFCKWQKMVNIKGDSHPTHHDVAILITRRDICAAMNRPCETLGLSHVSGMCQPHRSCNINEDTGLPLAFTIAHELGHSFGIQHDGTGNDCEPVGKRPFIMSPQLLYDTSPLTWSRCSRDYITRFLDRGWGLCLDDPPTKERLNYPSVPPGVLYDVGHQCRLQYGALSTFCQDIDNVCNTLWCTVGITCHSKLDAAVDGTKCGEDKWCFNGDCVDVGYRPGSINGAWGLWGLWSTCSRTCGAGVQYAERQCSNPTPKYGGKYCLGERKRYRICNIKPCTTNTPSFRQVQCMRFDSVLYKGKVHTWTPVHNMVNPCELHCRPEGEFFSEKLLDAVIDGTPCYEGNASRDMCINGICKNVGCDYEIDSGAVEDRCGVCHGNASTCQTVKKTFEESEGLGYVDIGLIPPGAREIRIEEVAEAGNFLALRGEDPENYFLNGGWTIQWNGDYSVAGTTFTYQRQGDLENLTSPGPTREPVWIQLLFQETNPGVRFQYVIHRELDEENEIPPPDFSWRYGSWTKCTATCGTGVQRQIALCVEKLSGIVEEKYCDSQSRPDDQQRECSREPCPARWWVGEWQACTATCGESGLARRTALCLQSVALDEQRALPASECQHLPKPDSSAPCNRGTPCPANWGAGNWSACSSTCGTGKKWRPVYCSNNTQAACSISQRPESEATCSLPPCPKRPVTTGPDWSGSGAASRELFNEIYHIPGHPVPKGIPTSPKHQGENVIPENGFISGHNKKNGVRGNGNPVVDDFYYDYNFINFHEDLSYDLPGERIGTPTESHEPKVKSEAARDHQHLPTPPSLHNSEGVFHPVDPTGKEAADDVRTPGASGTNLETQTKNGVFAMTKSLIEVTVSQTTSAVPYLKDEKDESETLLSGDLPLLEKQDTLQNSSDSSAENEHPGTWSIPAGSPEDAQVTDMLPHVSHTTLLPPADNVYTSSNGRLGEPRKQDNESSVVMGGSHSESHDTVNDTKDEAGTDQSADSPLTGNLFGNDFTQLPEEDLESEGVPENIQHQPDPHIHPTSTPTWRVPSSSGKYLAHPTALGIKKETDSRWSSPWTDQMQSRVDIDQERPDVHASNKQVYDIVLGTTTFRPVLSTASHGDQASVANSRALMSPAINNHNTESSNEHPSYDWSNFILTADPALQTSPSSLYQRGTTSWPASNEIHLSSDLEDHLLPTTSYNWETLGTGERPTSLPGEGSPEMPTSGEDKKLAPVMPSPLTQEGSGPSEPTSSTERQITADKARWEVGNWSQCSTTCGLGAIWRTVECSAGKDHRCDAATKPVPARRCYLRPCSFWHVGNWTKCSKNCGGGTTVRDVHCIDTRDQRLLRPFHCQAMLYKPPSQALCQPKPCMDWYTSSWRECSEACGGGAQERLVTCPEFGRCEDSARPNSTRPCGTQPCTKWVVGSWGQCTASCGGGIQRRLVKCVNTKTGDTEEDSSLCEHEVWPDNTQKCNPQDCEHTESSFICERDRLTFSFCQTLRILGRCHLPTVKVQCCRTCHPLSPGTRDRGNERASRR